MKSKKPKKEKPLTTAQKDKIFHKLIRDRDGCCVRCQSTLAIQCAHIVSRFYRRTRWDECNAMALCRGCHMFFTFRPIEWRRWVNKMFGDSFYEKMEEKALPLDTPVE